MSNDGNLSVYVTTGKLISAKLYIGRYVLLTILSAVTRTLSPRCYRALIAAANIGRYG